MFKITAKNKIIENWSKNNIEIFRLILYFLKRKRNLYFKNIELIGKIRLGYIYIWNIESMLLFSPVNDFWFVQTKEFSRKILLPWHTSCIKKSLFFLVFSRKKTFYLIPISLVISKYFELRFISIDFDWNSSI
jgi:hypothetical protein